MSVLLDIRSIPKDHHLATSGGLGERSEREKRAESRARLQLLTSASVGIGTTLAGVRISEVGGLIQAVSIVAGFLFAMLIWVLQTAASAANSRSESRDDLHYARVDYLRGLAASISFAAILAIACTAVLSLGLFTIDTELFTNQRRAVFSAVSISSLCLLTWTLLIVIRYAYAEAMGLIREARA